MRKNELSKMDSAEHLATHSNHNTVSKLLEVNRDSKIVERAAKYYQIDTNEVLALQQQGIEDHAFTDYERMCPVVRDCTNLPSFHTFDTSLPTSLEEEARKIIDWSKHVQRPAEILPDDALIAEAMKFGVPIEEIKGKTRKYILGLVDPFQYEWEVAAMAFLLDQDVDGTKANLPNSEILKQAYRKLYERITKEKIGIRKDRYTPGTKIQFTSGNLDAKEGVVLQYNQKANNFSVETTEKTQAGTNRKYVISYISIIKIINSSNHLISPNTVP